MAFEQLTYRESLMDIEACLRTQRNKMYHMCIRCNVSRNTLANVNKVRDWWIYVDFDQSLNTARKLYAKEDFGLKFNQAVYALYATTIDLLSQIIPISKYVWDRGQRMFHRIG